MITFNYVQGNGFGICYGNMTANESFVHPNNEDGIYNQFVYTYYGNINAKIDDQNGADLVEDQLNDLSSFFNKPITYSTNTSPAAWLAINPTPKSNSLNVTLYKEGSYTLSGNEKQKTILCVDKFILCNDKRIETYKFARIVDKSVVNLTVPKDAVAVLIETK
jgi:hypothetical protein